MRKKVVLVLGAGSSHEDTMPLGSALLNEVQFPLKQLYPFGGDLSTIDELDASPSHREFCRRCKFGGYESVDQLMQEHEELREAGSLRVDACLLGRQHGGLSRDNAFAHWRHRLFDRLLLSKEGLWRGFANPRGLLNDRDMFTVVTFNYDCLLEIVLARKLAGRFRVTTEQCMQIVNDLPIQHVHGRLDNNPGLARVLKTGSAAADDVLSLDDLRDVANGIYYPWDSGDPLIATELGKARLALGYADRIVFFGFGFGPINTDKILSPHERKSIELNAVEVVSTTINWDSAMITRVKTLFPGIRLLPQRLSSEAVIDYAITGELPAGINFDSV